MIRLPKSLLLAVVTVLCAIPCAWGADTGDFSYMPEFHGVFRGRWEMATEDGTSRFQVRNARLSVEGRVAPILGYLFRTDLCDRGEMKILDAYAIVQPVKQLTIKLGQYRMPFGMDSFRGPGTYYFNNRSFIGRRLNNVRAVGLSAAYTLSRVPITFDAGVFNPTSISDHEQWIKKYAFAGKVTYAPGEWKFTMGAESLRPADTRINLFGAAAGWGRGRFYAEAEYMCRTYTGGSHPATHAVNIFADYGVPLLNSLFDTWSFQGRFDSMSDLASGIGKTDGHLPTTGAARRRVTLGTTLDYHFRKVRAALRLNYEIIRADDHAGLEATDGDKLSVELVVKF